MTWRAGQQAGIRGAALAAALLAGCLPAGGGDKGGESAPVPADAKAECRAVKAPGDSAARQLRGMWITTVANIDWPSGRNLPAQRQQADYRRLLDTARALNMNAVFVQIRPNSDAFYRSPYEPWSQWITGTAGKDPGYDVLRFFIDEAHARGLEFHAWFNPYRVSRQPDLKKVHPASPARRHPDWVRRYGGGLWYDPGIPQVRELAVNAVLDVVGKYDIDAVHMDDYFYPYPEGGKFDDEATFKTYGAGMGKADWRRRNVDTLVRTLSQQIRRSKPDVRFGISPFGVWRNKRTDPAGSATAALQSYDDIHADTRTWIKQGWIDYVTPQLYWSIGDPRADYKTLVAWWARQVRGTKVQLTIGQGAYRVTEGGGTDRAWRRPAELARHLSANAAHPEVRGDVFFSAGDLMRNSRGFATRIRKDHYVTPAIPPPARRTGRGPVAIQDLRAESAGTGVRLRWRSSRAASYAVYRVTGRRPGCAPVDPAKLLVTTRGNAFDDATAKPGASYTYYVTALDRQHRESVPGRGSTVTARQG